MSDGLGQDDLAGSVVVAVDGSAGADEALDWAVRQASGERRRLVVFTAGSDAAEVATSAVERVRRSDPEVRVTRATSGDDPRTALVEISARAHLLVLGSRGRGSVRSLLLGSVGAAVAAQALCPVVICRPGHGRPGRGVLVGADATRESLPVIEFAFRQASLRGLPLTVVHSFWDAAAAVAQYRRSRGEEVEDPALDDLEASLSASVAGFGEKFPDVPVTLTLRYGLADEALSRREESWDLIVVGRHPMTTLLRTLTGSIATTVVERANTAVAVVPEELA